MWRTTVIGRLRGTQTETKLEHGAETVQGQLTYELGAGNEIVIGGLSEYPLKGTGLIKSKTFVRPVLGGTGKSGEADQRAGSRSRARRRSAVGLMIDDPPDGGPARRGTVLAMRTSRLMHDTGPEVRGVSNVRSTVSGVVSSSQFRLHPVGYVLGRAILLGLDRAAASVCRYRELAPQAPNELSTVLSFMKVPPSPDFPAELHGRNVLAVGLCHLINIHDANQRDAPTRGVRFSPLRQGKH